MQSQIAGEIPGGRAVFFRFQISQKIEIRAAISIGDQAFEAFGADIKRSRCHLQENGLAGFCPDLS